MNPTVGLPVLFAISLTSTLALALSPVEPPKYEENASFLSRRFLTDSRNAAALTDDFILKADRQYRVHMLFPNGGLLGSTGALDHAPFAAKIFLDRVNAYERANTAAFTLMPYLNGYSPQDAAHGANVRLDLQDRVVRAQIVAECTRYVSATVPGSYVAGAARPFDGIVLDLEPAGDPTFVASVKSLVGEIRASFDAMGLKSKKIGIAAPQYTDKLPKPNWGWNSSDFFNVARAVNVVVAMTYDSGLTDESKYEPWMSDQTMQILRAISGAASSFEPPHPKPTNGVRVLIGLPGFQTHTKPHDPNVENVAHGAAGIMEGLAQLRTKDPVSLGYFQGVAMYAHDGGGPDSAYARYDKDWSWWKRNWLGQ